MTVTGVAATVAYDVVNANETSPAASAIATRWLATPGPTLSSTGE